MSPDLGAGFPAWLPAAWRDLLPSVPLRSHCLSALAAIEGEYAQPASSLGRYIDESRFSVRQWLEAIAALDQWLAAQQRRASMHDQLNYLSCASYLREADLGWPLCELLAEMLDQHGFISG